jgi:hypothetical protein
MTLLLANDFSEDFANIPTLQAIDLNVAGSANPTGILDRLDIVDSSMRARIFSTDVETSGGIRSECLGAAQAVGDEIWLNIEVKIKSAEWAAPDFMSLLQIHEKDSIGSAVNFISGVDDGHWRLLVPNYALPATGNAGNFRTVARVPFRDDQWNKVSLHIKFVAGATGFREFYLNQERIFCEWDVGTAYTSDAPYPKWGVYDAFDNLDSGESATAYFRNLTIYSGVNSYGSMLGGAPVAPLVKGV